MIAVEAEIKARVRDPESVRQRLEALAPGRAETYQDTYYDDRDGTLEREDRELRLRTVHGPDGARSLLTYKATRVDAASGSKPEHETRVDAPDAVRAMLAGLGYLPSISFEKHCRNYEFEASGRRMLATLVEIPELDGTFIELETQVRDESELQPALEDIRAVLRTLGVHDEHLTNELYTDAVAARRKP